MYRNAYNKKIAGGLEMTGFKIITKNGTEIQFKFYLDEAPMTCNAFQQILPFTRTFYHARVSGSEIWIDNVPALDILQENASVFTRPGEVVVGPLKPTRVKTASCFGIYYGDGKGLDAANIFARVVDADIKKLEELGDSIWKNGPQNLTIEALTG
jgi:Protein of unknown function (DUF3830)